MSYGVGSDMNYADMILDSVGVANLDEVNLSYMIVSVVIFQKFTWLDWSHCQTHESAHP